MFHQHLFARPIAIVHATHLRQRHMALIHQQQPIIRKIINQRRRLLTRFTIRQIARIILNSLDKSRLAQHLKIVFGTLAQPLRLEQFAIFFKPLHPLVEFLFNPRNRMLDPLLRCRIVTRWENRHTLWLRDNFTRQRINLCNSLHLIAEKFDPLCRILPRRIDIHNITSHSEIPPRKVDIIALVLDIRK